MEESLERIKWRMLLLEDRRERETREGWCESRQVKGRRKNRDEDEADEEVVLLRTHWLSAGSVEAERRAEGEGSICSNGDGGQRRGKCESGIEWKRERQQFRAGARREACAARPKQAPAFGAI